MKIPTRYIASAAVALSVVAIAFIGWLLLKDAYVPVLQPAGEIAKKERDLIVFTVGLAVAVIIPVFILIAVFAFRYRDTNKKAVYDPEWSESPKLEAIWWGIPIAIIAVLSVVTWNTTHELDPYKPIVSDQKPMEVKVLAVRWKWLFFYPEQGVASVNHLVVPANRPLHFKLAADAPMSAFWIPALGSQIYNMNGMTSQLHLIADEVGEFKGYSTNINGHGYSKMEFDVSSVSAADFDSWVRKTVSSRDVMNMQSYASLAEPGVLDRPKYYSMPEDSVYDAVIAKYMKHMGHGDHGHSGMSHDTMEHHDSGMGHDEHDHSIHQHSGTHHGSHDTMDHDSKKEDSE